MSYYDQDVINPQALDVLFNPKTIAIIGASGNFDKPSGMPVKQLLLAQEQTGIKVFPVNPNYREMGGVPCYPDMAAVPGEIDLAIIAVPAALALEAMEQCVAKQVKAVITFTSGFAETGPEGTRNQEKLVRMAKEAGILLCGPNSMGLVNVRTRMAAAFAFEFLDQEIFYPLALGFAGQSGGFSSFAYRFSQQAGVPFNYFVSTGNEGGLGFPDYLAYMATDPHTSIIGSYMEGTKNGRRFWQAADIALQNQKPVVVIKMGKSLSGAKAIASHTGSLAGSDRVYDAFFKQKAIIRSYDVDQFMPIVTALAAGRYPEGKNVAILSGGGGIGVVMADKVDAAGLTLAEFSPETKERLTEILPFFAGIENPVDISSMAITEPWMMKESARVIIKDPGVDSMLWFTGARDEAAAKQVAQEVIEIYQNTSKPIIGVTMPGFVDMGWEGFKAIRRAGMPIMFEMEKAVQALKALTEYSLAIKARQGEEAPSVDPVPGARGKCAVLLEELKRYGRLSEYGSKQILRAYDIPTTRDILADTVESAVKAAGEIGYPVAMKVESPQIMHKTEAGGVRLNINSAGEVRRAFEEIVDAARRYDSGAEIRGVIVQEMLSGGTEVIVGVTNDPVFGPTVVCGLGGILVEVLQDVAMRVAPLVPRDAREMVREIRGYRILEGVRGQGPRDVEALEEILLKVSRMAMDLQGEVGEMDINPLMVFEKGRGAVAADALFVAPMQGESR